VVQAGRGCVEHLLNTLHGEVIACLHGVQEVIKLGIGAITIETDALQVVQAWSSCSFDLLSKLVDANFAYFRLIYGNHACL
jgi:hypothetical protein